MVNERNRNSFIGGSGLYKIPNLKNSNASVTSGFGALTKIMVGVLNGKEIASFLGSIDHNISPSKINYRANIDVLKQSSKYNLNISCNGLREDFKPMDFVLVSL